MIIDVFFWLIKKLGDEAFKKGISLIPGVKKRIGRSLLNTNKALQELEECLSWLMLALNAQASVLNGEHPKRPVEELNPYAQKTVYFFERIAENDAVAGMKVKHIGWQRMDDSDDYAPYFGRNSSLNDDGEHLSYDVFLHFFLEHTCRETYAAIEKTANAINVLLRLIQEGTLQVVDQKFYDALFRLDISDLLFGYWLSGHPPRVAFPADGNSLQIMSTKCNMDALDLPSGRDLFEGVADVSPRDFQPVIYNVNDKASIEEAKSVMKSFHDVASTSRSAVQAFLQRHFKLEDLL